MNSKLSILFPDINITQKFRTTAQFETEHITYKYNTLYIFGLEKSSKIHKDSKCTKQKCSNRAGHRSANLFSGTAKGVASDGGSCGDSAGARSGDTAGVRRGAETLLVRGAAASGDAAGRGSIRGRGTEQR